MGAECEMPIRDGMCGVAAVGRCSRCSRAACFSHLGGYNSLCKACQDKEYAAYIKVTGQVPSTVACFASADLYGDDALSPVAIVRAAKLAGPWKDARDRQELRCRALAGGPWVNGFALGT